MDEVPGMPSCLTDIPMDIIISSSIVKKLSCLLALLLSSAGVMNTNTAFAAGSKSTVTSNPPTGQIAQRSITCLRLDYNAGGVVHNGVLSMNGARGILITEFFSEPLGRRTRVQQDIEARDTPEGLLLAGYRPVFPETNRPYPSYSPDNFLLKVTPDNNVIAFNCDDARVCAPVRVSPCRR
jgi:hypothetical protein